MENILRNMWKNNLAVRALTFSASVFLYLQYMKTKINEMFGIANKLRLFRLLVSQEFCISSRLLCQPTCLFAEQPDVTELPCYMPYRHLLEGGQGLDFIIFGN
jgi:hypothetical protein